jgi:hypothetical protein
VNNERVQGGIETEEGDGEEFEWRGGRKEEMKGEMKGEREEMM